MRMKHKYRIQNIGGYWLIQRSLLGFWWRTWCRINQKWGGFDSYYNGWPSKEAAANALKEMLGGYDHEVTLRVDVI